VTFLDLEDSEDLLRLENPRLALEPLRGLVVIDEVQRRPELFPLLRVLADRPGRFLVLGSASPELLRQSSETLAGRIEYMELGGFSLAETNRGRSEIRRGTAPGALAPYRLRRPETRLGTNHLSWPHAH
jgi:predicted AAA+ superfamily ATPase